MKGKRTISAALSRKELNCPDNLRLLAFLMRYATGQIELVTEGSDSAARLWAAAAPKLDGRTTGHPLVCVLDEEAEGDGLHVLDAEIEPTVDQLFAMLGRNDCAVIGPGEVREVMQVTIQYD